MRPRSGAIATRSSTCTRDRWRSWRNTRASPYPFDKYDFVLLPTFPFPGMEHAGATSYNADELMLEDSATQQERSGARPLDRARGGARVVRQSGHDALVRRRLDQGGVRELHGVEDRRPPVPGRAARSRVLPGQPPAARIRSIVQQARIRSGSRSDNLADAADLYSSLIYAKAPVVMRQLEALMGESEFRDGLRSYLRKHSYANATWDDLIAALAPRAGFDLRNWSRVWIDEPGRPLIRTELRVADGVSTRCAWTHGTRRRRKRQWSQQLQVTLLCSGTARDLRVDLQATAIDLTRDAGGCVPDAVLGGRTRVGLRGLPVRRRFQSLPDAEPGGREGSADPRCGVVGPVGVDAGRDA